jgi:hypothetical protein
MPPNLPVPTPTDGKMWRKALRVAHPDTGGDHELFCWLTDIRGRVCGEGEGRPRRRRGPEPSSTEHPRRERIPYDGSLEFHELTSRALAVGQSVEEPFRSLLRLLIDCVEVGHGRAYPAQYIGASCKQMAYIGHLVGMGGPDRLRWCEIAGEIPLSARHGSHMVAKLKRVAA